ncbi:Crp/Fnr family transcriptional regulator [Sphingobacterium sp. UDSM-2020]|uniref:Crp/Fnr family transcriptional regulator n=1 Tax=Sphingobacterium sp. UDSM-2020 TaxID=2795738 RepID=UPI0019381508|nr:Crp/Fnr family transcriptional regulator [Sphingobacterium sp. UDSM-2020]QQD12664.1 Crp/Fnr family transcriptional regulator [Sphingobacterium sp. UDSM-2020]
MLSEEIIDQIRLKFKNQLDEEFLEELQKNALLTELRKGEILFSEQAKRNRIFVLINGSLVRFIVTPEGANRATMFHTETLFPMIGNNFENIAGSDLSYYIKANEYAKLIEFTRDFALYCIEKYPFIAKTSFMNMIDYFQTHHIIQNHLTALSSFEFFQWFLMQYGFIFKRFHSQDIASFMGITPEWFSKLKRKANKK